MIAGFATADDNSTRCLGTLNITQCGPVGSPTVVTAEAPPFDDGEIRLFSLGVYWNSLDLLVRPHPTTGDYELAGEYSSTEGELVGSEWEPKNGTSYPSQLEISHTYYTPGTYKVLVGGWSYWDNNITSPGCGKNMGFLLEVADDSCSITPISTTSSGVADRMSKGLAPGMLLMAGILFSLW